MRGCVQLLNPDPTTPAPPLATMYTSDPIFAGDTFIGRYTEKTIMPIFTNYLMGQPDGFTFDYSMYVNIPYPRYWLNSQRYDMGPLAEQILSLGMFSSNAWDALYPDDLFYLDRGSNSCNTGLSGMFTSSDPNPPFAMEYAYNRTTAPTVAVTKDPIIPDPPIPSKPKSIPPNTPPIIPTMRLPNRPNPLPFMS